MNEESLEAAKIRQINATAFKEESEARKLKYEVDRAIAESKLNFYRRTWFIKSAVAGFLLFTFLVGYVHFLFLPTQEMLRNEADTAVYTLQQRQAKFDSEKARLELLLEQATLEAIKASAENKSAKVQLEQANKSIKELKTALSEINEETGLDEKISEAKITINKQLKEIQSTQEILETQSDEIVRIQDDIQDVVKESVVKNGWIYLGSFPNDVWDYKKLKISDFEEPVEGKIYTLLFNANVRRNSPEFSFSGYKFGKVLGNLSAGQKVEIIETERVGFNKMWANIKVIK